MKYNRGVLLFSFASILAYEAGRGTLEGAPGMVSLTLFAASLVGFFLSWPVVCTHHRITWEGRVHMSWLLLSIAYLTAGAIVGRRFVTGMPPSYWTDVLFICAFVGFLLLALRLVDGEEVTYDVISNEGKHK